MHLSELKSKVVGDLVFVSESHVHVGDHEPGSSRLEVMRLPDGSFLIPASTWKGCFRSMAEKLARSLRLDQLERLALEAYAQNTYSLRLDDSRYEDYLKDFKEALRGGSPRIVRHGREELRQILKDIGYEEVEMNGEALERRVREMAADYLALNCPVGRLFGSQVAASKLIFHHTPLDPRSVGVEFRPGVGIDRASGSVREDILFFVEGLRAGIEVRLRFVADNLEPGASDSRLFAGVLDWIKTLGLQVGGRKSVGLGLLRLREGTFYFVGPGDDMALVNPFSHGRRLELNEFLSYLRGSE
ncbi:MAG: RAMP superfamily CRISPR-associated protein [Candidatus Caldarchaeales archaeon]